MKTRSTTTALLLAIATTLGACKHDAKIKKDGAAHHAKIAMPASITDVALPTSTNVSGEASLLGLRVYLGKKEIQVGDPPRVVAAVPADASRGLAGALKRTGPDDLFVVPLAAAVPKGLHDALVYLDRDTPFRLLIEVLFTLGQAEIAHYHIVTTGPEPGALNTIDVDPPKAQGAAHEPPTSPRLDATIIVGAEGVSVKARRGNVAPGCNDAGPGVTVPRAGDHQDFAALTACLVKLKAAAPDFADEHQLTLAANAGIHVQEIIATMDAARGPADAGVLFPDVVFGLVR